MVVSCGGCQGSPYPSHDGEERGEGACMVSGEGPLHRLVRSRA